MGACLSTPHGPAGAGADGTGPASVPPSADEITRLLMRVIEACNEADVMRMDCRDLARHARAIQEVVAANGSSIAKNREEGHLEALQNLEAALRDTADFAEALEQPGPLEPQRLAAQLCAPGGATFGGLMRRVQLGTLALDLPLEGASMGEHGGFRQTAALKELAGAAGGGATLAQSEKLLPWVVAVAVAGDELALELALAAALGGKPPPGAGVAPGSEVAAQGPRLDATVRHGPNADPETPRMGPRASSPARSSGSAAGAGEADGPGVPHVGWDYGISAVEPGAFIGEWSGAVKGPGVEAAKAESEPEEDERPAAVGTAPAAIGRPAEMEGWDSVPRSGAVKGPGMEAAKAESGPEEDERPAAVGTAPAAIGRPAEMEGWDSVPPLLARKPRPPCQFDRAMDWVSYWDGYERQVQEANEGTPTSISMDDIELSPESVIGAHYAPSASSAPSVSWGSSQAHMDPTAVQALQQLPRCSKEGGAPAKPTPHGPANTWAAGDNGMTGREYARLLQEVPRPAATAAAARRQKGQGGPSGHSSGPAAAGKQGKGPSGKGEGKGLGKGFGRFRRRRLANSL